MVRKNCLWTSHICISQGHPFISAHPDSAVANETKLTRKPQYKGGGGAKEHLCVTMSPST